MRIRFLLANLFTEATSIPISRRFLATETVTNVNAIGDRQICNVELISIDNQERDRFVNLDYSVLYKIIIDKIGDRCSIRFPLYSRCARSCCCSNRIRLIAQGHRVVKPHYAVSQLCSFVSWSELSGSSNVYALFGHQIIQHVTLTSIVYLPRTHRP